MNRLQSFSFSNSSSPLDVNTTGSTPFPYIGDPLPPVNLPPLTVGTGTPLPVATVSNPGVLPMIGSVTNWLNPLGALGDFLNIQYLTVEAVCAVTRVRLKPGEPVLILDEHIISKAAFIRLLRERFERMMLPEIEEMHEMTEWNS